MTLHWWMHWFWVTLITLTPCLSLPLAGVTVSVDARDEIAEPISERQGRAVYLPRQIVNITSIPPSAINASEVAVNQTTQRPDVTNVTILKANTTQPTTEKILPHPESSDTQRPKVSVEKQNITQQPVANNSLHVNGTVVEIVNKSKEVEPASLERDFLEADESGISVTERSLSQQRAPFDEFPSDVEVHPRDEEFSLQEASARSNVNAGVIAGASLASVAAVGALAAGSFALYRRRYINGPHAFNDKCSNPDSSGYLDDSTIRDNSEEMYSLDNDSFLNSLEAMTIQNYWTDTVKHTKL